jgi:hypothetical protein
MNAVPARRRSVVSVVVGALAMAGSFAVMGVLVLSDVADAKLENAPVVVSQTEQKPAPKKRARKKAKMDFGRFEGY